MKVYERWDEDVPDTNRNEVQTTDSLPGTLAERIALARERLAENEASGPSGYQPMTSRVP